MGSKGGKVRVYTFTIAVECHHCGNQVALNAPEQQKQCPSCLKTLSLKMSHWADQISSGSEGYKILGSPFKVRDQAISCRACGEELESELLLAAAAACPDPEGEDADPAAAGEVVACTCGASVLVAPAPGWIKELLPKVRHILGVPTSEDEGTAAEADTAAAKPVVLECPACAGALSVTAEDERTVLCQYCGVRVFIPDALWLILHPVKVVEAWGLAYTGGKKVKTRSEVKEEREQTQAQQREARQRREREEKKKEAEVASEAEEAADLARDADFGPSSSLQLKVGIGGLIIAGLVYFFTDLPSWAGYGMLAIGGVNILFSFWKTGRS